VLPWWFVLLCICIAIAFARILPLASMTLSLVAVLAQLLVPYSANFMGPREWAIYFGFAAVVFGVSASVRRRWQSTSFMFALGLAISVAGLLVGWDRLDWAGPIPVLAEDVGAIIANRVLIFVTSIGLSIGVWFFGYRARAWHETLAGHARRSSAEPDGWASVDVALAPESMKLRLASAGADRVFSGLSARESEIFMLAARGLSNAEIGQTAYISEATAKSIRSILAKLGLTSRTQLIAYAYDHGLVGPTRVGADRA
jgi:DNA-binding CsgD family transcriptional regulator